jgi:DNA polymerase (family 10)
MNNAQIADVFERIADLLEFEGANAFRIRAYRRGATTIRNLAQPISEVLADPTIQLTDMEGIGKDLAQKCETLVETGSLPMLEDLTSRIPASVLGMLRVPGLGPKKAAILYTDLCITTLAQLREAAMAGQIRKLKGFGEKTEQTILAGIDLALRATDRILWAEADELVTALRSHFARCNVISRIEFAGSYRRGKETVGDLDILVVSSEWDRVMDHLAKFPGVAETLVRGETKMSVRLDNDLQVDLRTVSAESFGAALQYFTGSKEHNVIVRGRAKKIGLKVNEWGVYRVKDDARIAGESEADVYAAVGLPWIPPELREARHEFDEAQSGEIPNLIDLADLRGDLHMHTTATDGKATLEEMVVAARQRGLSYIAITDHSQRVAMAQGLNEERLLAQWSAIDELNAAMDGFVVLKGIECDILEAGGMDLPDHVLARADWVMASIHYGQRQSREQITDRIIGAIENEYVSAIAHPTGRLLNRRDAYDVDMDAVIQAAKAHGKHLELNANPRRLDLDDVMCAKARSYGVKIVISSDAHSVAGLDVIRFGILQARRAGLTAKNVANTAPLEELLAIKENG